MTRIFYISKTARDCDAIISNARTSLETGKPMEPVRITSAIGEDPVINGTVISIKGDGPMYEIEVRG